MLFHRSGVFTIDPSLDLHILCEDEMIVVRLVHARSNALIMTDMALSIKECLTSALEEISQLYMKTSSDQSQTNNASFIASICCNSPDNPCTLQFNRLANIGKVWICPFHAIEHKVHTITSWIAGKDEDNCESGCPVTNEEFLKEIPSDLHLRRMSLLYSTNDVQELAIYLGLSTADLEIIKDTEDLRILNFEVMRQCRDKLAVTFKHIKEATEAGKKEISINFARYLYEIREINPKYCIFVSIQICTLVKGGTFDFDTEPEKWDLVPTEENIDRLAPMIGQNSLPFLIELGMDFQSWEQISHRLKDRDLVRLNKDILEEWSTKFCKEHSLKPTLRSIAQAFINIGKNVKIVKDTLSDLF